MANRLDIPAGRENTISRARLARRWKCGDSEARHTIARLRANPDGDTCAILSSPNGYYRSNDPEEIEQFLRATVALNRNTLAAIADAQRVLDGRA